MIYEKYSIHNECILKKKEKRKPLQWVEKWDKKRTTESVDR